MLKEKRRSVRPSGHSSVKSRKDRVDPDRAERRRERSSRQTTS